MTETDYDYKYLCNKCRVESIIEDLIEIKKNGYKAGVKCAECHGENFTKIPS